MAGRPKKRARLNPWKESLRHEASPCVRCGGEGKLLAYSHVAGGECFRCGGSGLDARNWRSYDPVEQFTLLGQPVRVYHIKGDLYALIREKDFQEFGKTLSLDEALMPAFLLKDGKVIPYNTSRFTPGLAVHWPILRDAFPDYMDLRDKFYDIGGYEELTPAEKRRWDSIARSSKKLSEKLLQALQGHYNGR